MNIDGQKDRLAAIWQSAIQYVEAQVVDAERAGDHVKADQLREKLEIMKDA